MSQIAFEHWHNRIRYVTNSWNCAAINLTSRLKRAVYNEINDVETVLELLITRFNIKSL